MKVSVSNLHNGVISSALKNSKASKQSFGNVGNTKKLLLQEISKRHSWLDKKFIDLGHNNGEILNTIVTGIGTAFVAPIFIIWNPLAKKTDKETRVYSAWRQPISAVLAVATQIAINKKFNNWMDKEASVGTFDRMNLKAEPRKSYLTTLVKLQHPDWNKKEVAAEVEKLQTQAKWDKINAARSSKKYTDRAISYEELIDKDTFDKAKESIQKKIDADFKALKDSGASADDLKAFKNAHGKDYLFTQAKTQAINIVKDELESDASLKSIIRNYQKADNFLNGVVKDVDAEVKTIAENFKNYKIKNSAATMMDFAIEQTNNDIKRLVNGEKLKLDATTTQKLADKLVKMMEYEKATGKKPFGSVKHLGDSFDEILKNVKIKKLVLKEISDATNVLKDSKTKWGIVVSLITLPFSCGLLNWVYPRLMEKIMPNTAKKKKEAQKMEAKA